MSKENPTNVNDIIENYLKPRLKMECDRLRIPCSFISGISGIYPDAFLRTSLCQPIVENGEIKSVYIRINSEITRPQIALLHLWHELRHAKDYYAKRKPNEWKAITYMLTRSLEQLIRKTA